MAAAISPRVFISSGEASGDAYGALFVSRLRALRPDLQFFASGGARLEAEIGALVCDSRQWGAISITQSLKVVPRVAWAFSRMVRFLRKGPPGLFVPIDFGFVNARLMRVAKQAGWKVLCFVPPGSWRRDRQGRGVVALSDAISTPFPWSAEILRSMGASNVHWFGHPIKEFMQSQLHGLDVVGHSGSRRDQIALLPGSRRFEIRSSLEAMASVVRPEEAVEFAVAGNVDTDALAARWRALTSRSDPMTVGRSAEVMRRSRAGIVCSGTVTLEAALCHMPMVVIYRLSKVMYAEAKLIGFKRPEFIALPNILLQRRVVPEPIVGLDPDATPEQIRLYIDELLERPEAQLAAFEEIDALLGGNSAITQTAELAAEMF